MKNFLRITLRGRRCAALSQYYKSGISDNMFEIFSQELNVRAEISILLETYFYFLGEYEFL